MSSVKFYMDKLKDASEKAKLLPLIKVLVKCKEFEIYCWNCSLVNNVAVSMDEMGDEEYYIELGKALMYDVPMNEVIDSVLKEFYTPDALNYTNLVRLAMDGDLEPYDLENIDRWIKRESNGEIRLSVIEGMDILPLLKLNKESIDEYQKEWLELTSKDITKPDKFTTEGEIQWLR